MYSSSTIYGKCAIKLAHELRIPFLLLSLMLAACSSEKTTHSAQIKGAASVLARATQACNFDESIVIVAFITVNDSADRIKMDNDQEGETASINLRLSPGDTVHVEIDVVELDSALGSEKKYTIASASKVVPNEGDIVLVDNDMTLDCKNFPGFEEPDDDPEGGTVVPVIDACQENRGSDPGSTNYLWNDNCHLAQDANFSNSTYVQGVQRVLYCRGYGGAEGDINVFADGIFGPNTDTAVREFQEREGLIVDGIVGPETWGRMQELVETFDTLVSEDSDEFHDAFGVLPVKGDAAINCLQQTNFFGRKNSDVDPIDTYEGWELAKVAGENIKGAFSIDPPQ